MELRTFIYLICTQIYSMLILFTVKQILLHFVIHCYFIPWTFCLRHHRELFVFRKGHLKANIGHGQYTFLYLLNLRKKEQSLWKKVIQNNHCSKCGLLTWGSWVQPGILLLPHTSAGPPPRRGWLLQGEAWSSPASQHWSTHLGQWENLSLRWIL